METYLREKARIIAFFNAEETLIDDFLCCPHQSSDQCECKKPKTALIQQSERKFGLNVAACFVIGDMGKNEIVMAKRTGCKGVLVLTGAGQGSLGAFRHTWMGYEADIVAENALKAVESIVK